jgi:hypothetical protein
MSDEAHETLVSLEARGIAGAVDLIQMMELSNDGCGDPNWLHWVNVSEFVARHNWQAPMVMADLAMFLDSHFRLLHEPRAQTPERGQAADTELRAVLRWLSLTLAEVLEVKGLVMGEAEGTTADPDAWTGEELPGYPASVNEAVADYQRRFGDAWAGIKERGGDPNTLREVDNAFGRLLVALGERRAAPVSLDDFSRPMLAVFLVPLWLFWVFDVAVVIGFLFLH